MPVGPDSERWEMLVSVGRRLGFAALVLWFVLSLLFVAMLWAPSPDERNPLTDTEAEGLDDDRILVVIHDDSLSLIDRYWAWMERYLTLDWGETVRNDEVVSYERLVLNRLAVTTVLLLPAVLLTGLVGVVAGLYAGLNPGSDPDRVARTVAYLGFAIPSFFLGIVVTYYGIYEFDWRKIWYDPERTLWSVYNFKRLALPSAVLAVGILGVQLRQVRSAALQYRTAPFVRLVRAKGGGFRTVARHVFRVTLLPVVSAFLSELLGLLLLSVIAVEMVFQVPGYGVYLLDAAYSRQPDPIVAVTLVTVGIAVTGRLIEDSLATVLDPRVDGSDR
jgi:peptide/nickel transport system permease protein